MPAQQNSQRRRLILVIGIFAVFVIPMLLAGLLYRNNHHFHFKTTNRGQLVRPPLSIQSLPITHGAVIHGKWLMLLLAPSDCRQQCQQKLFYLRQIRIATGKNRQRVARVMLTPRPLTPQFKRWLSRQLPGTQLWRVNQEALKRLLAKRVHANYAAQPGTIYLVDPLGNIMMSYRPDAQPTDILRDLQHLLKNSQIG